MQHGPAQQGLHSPHSKSPRGRADQGLSANLAVKFYLPNHCEGAGQPPLDGSPVDHQPVPVRILTGSADVGQHRARGGDRSSMAAE